MALATLKRKPKHSLPPLPGSKRRRYPINNARDVEKAVRAVGRTAPAQRPKVRRHVMSAAAKVGASHKIPPTWRRGGKLDMAVVGQLLDLAQERGLTQVVDLAKPGQRFRHGWIPIAGGVPNGNDRVSRARESSLTPAQSAAARAKRDATPIHTTLPPKLGDRKIKSAKPKRPPELPNGNDRVSRARESSLTPTQLRAAQARRDATPVHTQLPPPIGKKRKGASKSQLKAYSDSDLRDLQANTRISETRRKAAAELLRRRGGR